MNDILDETMSVKSEVIAKYSHVLPTNYTELKSQTNLKLPPSNWFLEAQKWHDYIPQFRPKLGLFSSGEMADTYLDYVGEVDVISDAKNIKSLLKIPFSKNTVSMMVHRIGKTLLLDDFDVHKYLLRTAENDWEWLRKFYAEHILESCGKDWSLLCKDNSIEARHFQTIESQFLYQSMRKSNTSGEPINNIDYSNKEKADDESIRTENLDRPKFAHNVLWSFEDIQMLIGSNMPIFGNGVKPCVSLRLHDMAKPINVLTGLDYWLDNLMCNVPEVIMCYHLDYIVQKYECIKTEELPTMEGSKFSPKVVRDVAQNILSFLKSNATKPGHTYWLFKGESDDVVKLYDLTSVCPEIVEEPVQNPFTTPVALLLYRVACNLINLGRSTDNIICCLLKKCISLLDMSYSKIISQAHFLLSDLYVPFDVNPSVFFESETVEEADKVEEKESSCGSCSLDISELCLSSIGCNLDDCSSIPSLGNNFRERCLKSLEHVYLALSALNYSVNKDNDSIMNSFMPIPMPNYVKNKMAEGFAECNSSTFKFLKSLFNLDKLECNQESNWIGYLRGYLFQKGLLSSLALGDIYSSEKGWGQSLKYAGLSLSFYYSLVAVAGESEALDGIKSCIFGLQGDLYFHIVYNWDDRNAIVHDLNSGFEYPLPSVLVPYSEMCGEHIIIPESKEGCLLESINFYKKALSFKQCSDRVSLLRRIGNIHNELGVLYMNKAIDDRSNHQYLCKSEQSLENGIKYFESIDDNVNLSLLYSNVGRLKRLYAHVNENEAELQVSEKHKSYYRQALDQYQKALHVLGKRDKYPTIWDSVSWELCTTYFNLATLLQEFSPIREEMEDLNKEVSSTFHQALVQAQMLMNRNMKDARVTMYKYRVATIHHRLASLYHYNFRKMGSQAQQNRNFKLADYHYSKSLSLLSVLNEPELNLKVVLEKIGLLEQNIDCMKNQDKQKKAYMEVLKLLMSHKVTVKELQPSWTDGSNVPGLIITFLQRLQNCLLTITKKVSHNKNRNGNETELSNWKFLYGLSLKMNIDCTTSSFSPNILELLAKIDDHLFNA